MPRTNLSQPKYPPIDWARAAVLERKHVMKLDWADLALAAKITPDSMRKMAASKSPEAWPPEVRRAVFRKLGISVRVSICDEHSVVI